MPWSPPTCGRSWPACRPPAGPGWWPAAGTPPCSCSASPARSAGPSWPAWTPPTSGPIPATGCTSPSGRPRTTPAGPARSPDLDAAGDGDPAEPAFRKLDKTGRVLSGRLSDPAVTAIVQRRAAAAGYDPTRLGGHSLRAGFVTAGTDAPAIMRQTGHRTPAMILQPPPRPAGGQRRHPARAVSTAAATGIRAPAGYLPGGHRLPAGPDPASCPPCVWLRWARALGLARREVSIRVLRAALDRAAPLSSASPHRCRIPPVLDRGGDGGEAVFTPID